MKIHPCCCMGQECVLCCWVKSIVWIYHNLCIHSPVDGHLDCFQFVAIKSWASVKIYVQVFAFQVGFESWRWKYISDERSQRSKGKRWTGNRVVAVWGRRNEGYSLGEQGEKRTVWGWISKASGVYALGFISFYT